MNCPKCNAPLNEGDKFCQTCGSLVPQEPPKEENVQPAEPVVNESVNQTPEVQPVPVVENQPMPTQPMNDMGYMQTPMNNMNQPMNYNQPQPMNQNMNYNQPMNNVSPNQTVPNEPKKNNTVVYVLMAFIVVLLAVVVFLLVTSGKDEDKDKTSNNNNNEVTESKKDEDEEKEEDDNKEEVIASNYTKTNVNEFTLELPEGYNAGYYGDSVVFYDENMTDVEGYLIVQNGYYGSIDKEQSKLNFMALGIENITYTEKNFNNKNMLVFSGEYEGYDVELIFLEYSYSKMIGAEVYYGYGTTETKEDVYDIISRITIDDSAFSTTTNTRIPGLDISSVIGQ